MIRAVIVKYYNMILFEKNYSHRLRICIFCSTFAENLGIQEMLIIFDLDGTLINTIDDLGQACNHALQACGFPTHKIEDYPRLVGNGVNNLIRRALPEAHQNEATVCACASTSYPTTMRTTATSHAHTTAYANCCKR